MVNSSKSGDSLGRTLAGDDHRPSIKTARTPTDKSVWGIMVPFILPEKSATGNGSMPARTTAKS